ncbi:MAG: argininosuccinate lyase [Candidatus Aminicenantes bacterium]|nr:argininosuccinate lyase [Candidatus Aminicenantes bacterium]
MKVWQKRFGQRENLPVIESFNASIDQDSFLYEEEIEVSLAYSRALAQANYLSPQELALIETGLEKVKARIKKGEALDRFEDIHSAVELMLVEEIGEVGGKLATGRSRNEQVATIERLYLKKKIPSIIDLIRKCQLSLIDQSEKYFDVVVPAFTHLRPAQYVLFSHYLMAYFWPLERAKSRLDEALRRLDKLPLGSGALAGSSIYLDREYLKKLLGFLSLTENSIDAVSDRSYLLEIAFDLSLLRLDLSRMAEDLIIFSTDEFGLIEISPEIQTSSSLMPQKKNPDILELLRASCGSIFGDVTNLFIILKGLPLSYNKDMQADKDPLKKMLAETEKVLEVLDLVIKGIKPAKRKLEKTIDYSLMATDLVDYLVQKGLPFRQAHRVVSEVINYAESKGEPLNCLSLDQMKQFSPLFSADVDLIFDPWFSITNKKTAGSTHPDQVKKQIELARQLLKRD